MATRLLLFTLVNNLLGISGHFIGLKTSITCLYSILNKSRIDLLPLHAEIEISDASAEISLERR